MKLLQTTTLTTQNIATPLAVATYTAADDRELLVHVYLSGLAGDGTYRACLTKQRAGAGAHFQGATAAIPVASGATTVWLEAMAIAVTTGDVVKAWVQGLVGDVSVGVVTDVFDGASVNVTLYLGQTPPDLDGLDGLDGSTLALEATAQAILASGSGSGSTAYSNTITDTGGNPLDGVEVWITSDSGGASTVASTTTDTLGAFTVYLDPGTYYLWLAKGGYNFGNPTAITVT